MVKHLHEGTSPGRVRGTDLSRRPGLVQFLYDIAKAAFGAAVMAGCLRGETGSILVSLLFSLFIVLAALHLEKKNSN